MLLRGGLCFFPGRKSRLPGIILFSRLPSRHVVPWSGGLVESAPLAEIPALGWAVEEVVVMTLEIILRTLALCLALAGAETLHGIARTVFPVPRAGKARALKLSILSGTAIAFALCWILAPGIGLSSLSAHLALGFVLAAFMAGFDLALGMLLLKRPLRKALDDFNPATGNLLVFGLAALFIIPALVAGLRGLMQLLL